MAFLVLLTLPYIAVSPQKPSTALDQIVDRLTSYMDSRDTNETSYVTPFKSPSDDVPSLSPRLIPATGRLLLPPSPLAPNKKLKRKGVGHSFPPSPLVRLPHRTRIKYKNSPNPGLLVIPQPKQPPSARTTILFLHVPPPRKTNSPTIRPPRLNPHPRRDLRHNLPTRLQPQRMRTLTNRSPSLLPHRPLPPSWDPNQRLTGPSTESSKI